MNHILYATDKNYCEVCAVSLYSLLSKFSGKALIHIIESNLEERKDDLIKVANMFDQKIEFIPINEIEKKLSQKGVPPYRGGYAPYARFFCSEYIDANKVLYLDCDIIVNGDLAPLFDYDLKGNPIAAVVDQATSYVNLLIGHKLSDKYFNSGVLLIDNKLCQVLNTPQKFVDAVNSIDLANTFIGADQDIMNVAFYNQITSLPVTYNMMYTTRSFSGKNCLRLASKTQSSYYSIEEFEKARQNPIVIHFAGGAKYQPWREEGYSFSQKEALMWSSIYEKLYPNGRYSEIAKNKKGKKPQKLPALYSITKGFLRKVKLLPKLIKSHL